MEMRRALWIFAFLTLAMAIADRLLFVLFPNYLLEKGFSATEIGAVFSAAALVLVISRFLIGKISDIHGRKKILSFGLLLQSAAIALFPFLARIWEFAIVKSVKEFGDTLHGSVEDAIVADTFPKKIRARTLSKLGTAFPIGRALGALIGIAVTTWLTVAQGFLVAAAFVFAALIIFALGFKSRETTHYRGLKFSLKNYSKRFKAIAVVGLLASISFGAAYFPGFFMLAKNLGISESMLFGLLLAGYVVSSALAWHSGRWIDRVGRGNVVVISSLMFSLFTAAYALAASFLAFTIIVLGITASFYIWRIAFKTVLMDSTVRRLRGEQIGFNKMLTGIGDMIGPLIGGLLIDFVSLPVAFGVAGAFGLAAAAFSALAAR